MDDLLGTHHRRKAATLAGVPPRPSTSRAQESARPSAGVPARVLFFSSRRRHTRFDCDWSSDVCSSDLFRRQGLDIASGKAYIADKASESGSLTVRAKLSFATEGIPCLRSSSFHLQN